MPSLSPAQSLLQKADKKANSSTGWFSSSSTKYEEAGDLYQQAANAFKLEKLFREAGDAFAREAECREKCKEANDAANAWWNAAKAYKQGFPDRELYPLRARSASSSAVAIQALSQTIVHLTASGRFRQAADREKEIAQIYQNELADLRKACESFVRAGDWYSQEDAAASVFACRRNASADICLVPQTHAIKTLPISMPNSKNTRRPLHATTRSPITRSNRPSQSTASRNTGYGLLSVRLR